MKFILKAGYLLVLFFGVLSCKDTEMKNPMIVAHRGAMGYEMENTIASIEKAIELKAPMIEIDVFQIASGELVVFHDGQLDRLSNGTGPIVSYDWKSLSEVVLDGGHSIPLLSEVLAVVKGKAKLNIELKGPHTALPVLALLEPLLAAGEWTLEDIILSSFDWPLLMQARLQNSRIPIAVLTEGDPLDAIDMARSVQASAINPYFKSLNPEVVKKIQAAGYQVFTWTVNSPEDLAAMKAMGVDGIITNFPDRRF